MGLFHWGYYPQGVEIPSFFHLSWKNPPRSTLVHFVFSLQERAFGMRSEMRLRLQGHF